MWKMIWYFLTLRKCLKGKGSHQFSEETFWTWGQTAEENHRSGSTSKEVLDCIFDTK